MTDSRTPVEPQDVYPEEHFERAVVEVLRSLLTSARVDFVLLPRFGLDTALFIRRGGSTRALLIEAKSYSAQRQGGVGFGNGRGEGPQVDVLMSDETAVAILDGHVRWAFVDATRPHGASRYGLFTCTEAKCAAMGGVERGKQNNLRAAAFQPQLIGWSEFCGRLDAFILPPEA